MQLMSSGTQPTLEDPSPPALPDIMLTETHPRLQGSHSDPTSKINLNVSIPVKPHPRTTLNKALVTHPATKARSTRASLPNPGRKSTRTKTEPQNRSDQTRDPDHIEVQLPPKNKARSQGEEYRTLHAATKVAVKRLCDTPH